MGEKTLDLVYSVVGFGVGWHFFQRYNRGEQTHQKGETMAKANVQVTETGTATSVNFTMLEPGYYHGCEHTPDSVVVPADYFADAMGAIDSAWDETHADFSDTDAERVAGAYLMAGNVPQFKPKRCR